MQKNKITSQIVGDTKRLVKGDTRQHDKYPVELSEQIACAGIQNRLSIFSQKRGDPFYHLPTYLTLSASP